MVSLACILFDIINTIPIFYLKKNKNKKIKKIGDLIGLFLFKVGDIHFRQLQIYEIFFFLALSVFLATKRGIGVLDL